MEGLEARRRPGWDTGCVTTLSSPLMWTERSPHSAGWQWFPLRRPGKLGSSVVGSVWVSQGCCKKGPQIWWLNSVSVCSLMVLE